MLGEDAFKNGGQQDGEAESHDPVEICHSVNPLYAGLFLSGERPRVIHISVEVVGVLFDSH